MYRRSQVELLDQLNSLFDSLPSGSRPTSPLLSLPSGNTQQVPRTAPLRLLPDLLTAFEQKRGVHLLTVPEREQLRNLVDGLPEGAGDQPVGVEQVLGLLVQLGVAGGSSSSSSSSEADELPASPIRTTSTRRPGSPTACRSSMLRPDPSSAPSDGWPISNRHRRTTSSSSLSSMHSSTGPPSSPAAATASLLTPSSAARRRSLISSLSRSSPSSSSASNATASLAAGAGGVAGKTLRKKRTFEDLSQMVAQQGGTYLGGRLDGPTGEGWEVGREVERVRGIVGAKALNRDRDLVNFLAPLTYPQLKALDRAYLEKGNGRDLLDAVTSEKAFKGNVEFAARGMLMGPLAWDVWLLQRALDRATTNDNLLVDLLISRPPSALALLRAAYSHRSSHLGLSSPSPSSPASTSTSKSLDVAVLSAFSSNVRLRKAWEVALQGRWEDTAAEGEAVGGGGEVDEVKRKKLLREDLDQLKVALRRGGHIEIVAKILLARSPTHLHSLTLEYRRSTSGHSSLTKAIKQCVPTGTLQKLFLHAVENAKNVGEVKAEGLDVGVWRDAKAIERAIDVEKGGRREELLWRLIRLHWNRPRFLAIQQAYKQKYRKSPSERLSAALPVGALADLSLALLRSASVPEPTPSVQDRERLTKPRAASIRSRTSSASSLASMPEEEDGTTTAGRDSENEAAASDTSEPAPQESSELEAEGEMSDPPSPRSPSAPYDDEDRQELDFPMDEDAERVGRQGTPVTATFSTAAPDAPTLPRSPSRSQLDRSVSSDRENQSHGRSSSLGFRQRSAPLDFAGHRPPSSTGGSTDSTKLSSSLRHSRPIAPSRAKRRQSEDTTRQRGDSEEPLSPSRSGLRSPTPSNGSRASLSRSTSTNGDSLASSTGSSRSAAIGMGNTSVVSTSNESFFGSPPTSIDTRSFHPTPLSPNAPPERSSSSFFPGSTPPPASPPSFDLSAAANDFFTSSSSLTPAGDSPDKYFSSLRRQGSTVSHLSSGSRSGSGGLDSRPTSMFAGEGGMGLSGSLFGGIGGSPAGHGRDGSGGSMLMMLSGGEQVQQLLRQSNDLMKKLKETEARLQASASAYEEQVSDLEVRLEEARSDLQSKRREEKELRGTEKEHLVQINSLEADIAKLTKNLERSREAYDSMKRNYTATCDEAERLRALVAETRRENRAAEEAMQNHALQVQQFDRDRDLLQQAINKLEEDLGTARRAQDSLDDQKQENLLLKETIDKLRFEIEEMRSARRKSQFLDGAVAPGSPAKSLAESLSKSLGREIANQMAAQQDSDSSEDEGEETAGEEDEVDDIIVTTHRRIKKRSKKTSPAPTPVVTHVETNVTVSDADIQTEPITTTEMGVQTDLSAINSDLIAAPAVEPEVIVLAPPAPPPKTEKEIQEDLAKGLGVDVELVKQFVDASKNGKAAKLVADATTLAASRRSGRWRQRLPMARAPAYLVNAFPTSARPYVAQMLDSGVSLVLYSATIYLLGVVSGSLLPSNHHHTFAPFNVMLSSQDSVAYNSMNWEGLAPGSSNSGLAREGLPRFLYDLVWHGVRATRRVPT
ncbi:hypothetical protein JCM11641_002904 [Rhodosporidiobolus odoratus]